MQLLLLTGSESTGSRAVLTKVAQQMLKIAVSIMTQKQILIAAVSIYTKAKHVTKSSHIAAGMICVRGE